MKNLFELILCIALCMAAGIVGALFTVNSIGTWYAGLNKPFFNPPSWIFAPVWNALYIMMGVAVFLVWRRMDAGAPAKAGLLAFAAQLILNAIWSPIFFGARSILGAFIVIVLLLQAIGITIFLFYKVSKPAAALLVPYILWISFATVLNGSLLYLNR